MRRQLLLAKVWLGPALWPGPLATEPAAVGLARRPSSQWIGAQAGRAAHCVCVCVRAGRVRVLLWSRLSARNGGARDICPTRVPFGAPLSSAGQLITVSPD